MHFMLWAYNVSKFNLQYCVWYFYMDVSQLRNAGAVTEPTRVQTSRRIKLFLV